MNQEKNAQEYIIPNPYENIIAYDWVVKKNIKDILSNWNYQNIINDELFDRIAMSIDNKIDKHTNIDDIINFISAQFSEQIKETIFQKENHKTILNSVWYGDAFKWHIKNNLEIYLKRYKENKLSYIENQNKWFIDLQWNISREKNTRIGDYEKSLLITIVLYAIMMKETDE